jgi:hypothetical protein
VSAPRGRGAATTLARMGPVAIAALVVAVLAVSGVYLSWTAGRIDRLHRRVEAARAALDAQLVRRAAAAEAWSARAAASPPTERLRLAAAVAVHAEGLDREREDVENGLSRALHAACAAEAGTGPAGAPGSGADADPELAELAAACRKVALARRFYNDAVRDTLVLRGRRLPRLLHLAGRAPAPGYFDIDDSAIPGALSGVPAGRSGG